MDNLTIIYKNLFLYWPLIFGRYIDGWFKLKELELPIFKEFGVIATSSIL